MQLNDPIYNLTINMRDSSRASRALADLAPPDSGDGSPEVRIINMLQAVRVKKLSIPGAEVVTAAIEDNSDQDEQDDISSYEGWDYSRPTTYAPSHDRLSTCLAPHVKILPVHSGSITSAPAMFPSTLSMDHVGTRSSKRPPDSEPASAPRFLIRVSSNSNDIHDQVMLGRTNLPQDLIFSIVIKQSEINQYLLMELTIDIALGSNDPTYFLMSNYTGPGAHMLTNLRFNAFLRRFMIRIIISVICVFGFFLDLRKDRLLPRLSMS
ncbi:hypothetical protein FAUST_11636 [Fusarium austroamericanum]|uniref:Uncharacterized protein n=1 Tax=Fusarium austroamericanum TaxID=282268 RepID=A0AAN5YYH6_FUSAU|nr:hypothetical protein FAUST_11636 [Fusarium austroamericanum]